MNPEQSQPQAEGEQQAASTPTPTPTPIVPPPPASALVSEPKSPQAQKQQKQPSLGDQKEDEEVVKTIVVSGLPEDTTARELEGFFLFAQGFEQTMIREGPRPMGFVRFTTQEDAMAAVKHLNGRELNDTENSITYTLCVAMANKNLRPRGRRGSAPGKGGHSNPPCDTMFIGNLPENSEGAVQEVLQNIPNFVRMKYVANKDAGKSPMCFAQFETVAACGRAIGRIEAGVLSMPGLRVDYSVNPLDVKDTAPVFAPQQGYSSQGVMQRDSQYHIYPRRRSSDRQESREHTFFKDVNLNNHRDSYNREILNAIGSHPTHQFRRESGGTGGKLGGQNPPCDTMFIGSLPSSLPLSYLSSTLQDLPGFVQLKIVPASQNKSMCFVRFQSVSYCQKSLSASFPWKCDPPQFARNSLGKVSRH